MVPDLNQLPWLLHRRWTKYRRVYKTENCRVHANAQTKRKRDHQGKDWRLAQHAQGIADILKKNGHGLTLSVTQSAPLPGSRVVLDFDGLWMGVLMARKKCHLCGLPSLSHDSPKKAQF